MAAAIMTRHPRFLGRCKSCKLAVRVDSPVWVPSAVCDGCGGRVKLEQVIGVRDDSVKCGGSCRSAVGPSCDCSCGGANHGANH